MSTDTFAGLEARLRSDLPRLADTLATDDVGAGPTDADVVRSLEPSSSGGRRRRWLVPTIAVAAVVLVLVGIVLVMRSSDDRDARPVDVGPAPVESGWAPMATSPLSPREAAVSVWTGTEVIVWGGRLGNTALLDGAAYDPATDTWRTIASNSWGHPGAHAVWTGTEMVVLAKNGGAAYDPVTDTWRDLPLLRGGGGSFLAPAWTGDALLGIGVDVAANDTSVSLAASTLSGDGSTWEDGGKIAISDNVFDTSADYQVAWSGSEAVVWDGHMRGWVYDPTARTWRSLPCDGCTPHAEPDRTIPVAVDQALYLVSSSHLGPESYLSLAVPTTDPLAGELWVGRGTGVTGRLDPGSQAVPAGGDRAMVLSTAMAPTSVDLSTGEWVDTDPDQRVLGGAYQSAVWTGEELVVWGGADGSGQVTANGWRWHPGG